MARKVLIIGGGMAGLSAGSYLQMNGYDTEIFELNNVPGGVCTSWKRGEYTVDFCIHWLAGTGKDSSFYPRWKELIDIDKLEVHTHDEYARVEDTRGNELILYTDVAKLEDELLAKAPEDRSRILEFTRAIRRMSSLKMDNEKAFELTNIWERLQMLTKMLPYMGTFNRFMTINHKEYASEFKNPLLQKAIYNLFEPDMAMIFSIMTFAFLNTKSAGYPIGGSMNFAMQLYERYLDLGGRFKFDARVERILTEKGRAVGVELDDGRQFFGDYVVSAADGYNTIYKMLEGQYTNDKINTFYQQHKTFPSLVFIALGVNDALKAFPHTLLLPVGKTIIIDYETIIDQILLRTHNFDPTLAPEGKSLQTIMVETYNYEYWEDLYRNNPAKYKKEKDRIGQEVIAAIDRRFPGYAEKVEMIDIATPVTLIRFTNNWKGSFEGFQIEPSTQWPRLPHALPGLNNFFMCGQWVAIGGGLPSVVFSGREVAQLICHADERPFVVQDATEIEV